MEQAEHIANKAVSTSNAIVTSQQKLRDYSFIASYTAAYENTVLFRFLRNRTKNHSIKMVKKTSFFVLFRLYFVLFRMPASKEWH